jgi:CRP/FNR family cyclic AMP-dependent transcriptional regulator
MTSQRMSPTRATVTHARTSAPVTITPHKPVRPRLRELPGRIRGQFREWVPHRHSRSLLATMPVFAGCSRRQLFRIARWGDLIEVPRGTVLVRELHVDYWFLVVLDGRVRLTRGGRTIGRLGTGGHFGEVSIVGFRPQTATAIADEPTLLFVIGRRYLLSLAEMDASIQRVLFPALPPGGYRTFVRDLQAGGRRDWEKLDARRPLRMPVTGAHARPAGRRLTWAEAIERLSHAGQAPDGVPAVDTRPQVAPAHMRVRLAALAAAVVALSLVVLIYHPPLAVITPGSPIDVTEDITISGAREYPVRGRYLLTPVRIERPNLARTLLKLASGEVIVRTNTGESQGDPHAAEHEGRAAMLASHRDAIELAERALRMAGRDVDITIRDRGILGPSGGLIYALAIADMLGADDLASGRAIAATGELVDGGDIAPVGFIALKAKAAHHGAAAVFFVPQGQTSDARMSGVTIRGVRSL